MADRHLEAAAEELMAAADAPGGGDYWEALADRTVTAYLDSLLGELPEEMIQAVAREPVDDAWPPLRPRRRTDIDRVLKAAIRSLRDSLASRAA